LDEFLRIKLHDAIRDLMTRTQGIDAVAIVSMDGFVMASNLPVGFSEERLGAMSAALLSLGERTSEELGRGELSQVFIEGGNGYVFLLAAGENAVLNVVVRKGTKLGLVLYDIRQAARNIAEIIESSVQVKYE